MVLLGKYMDHKVAVTNITVHTSDQHYQVCIAGQYSAMKCYLIEWVIARQLDRVDVVVTMPSELRTSTHYWTEYWLLFIYLFIYLLRPIYIG